MGTFILYIGIGSFAALIHCFLLLYLINTNKEKYKDHPNLIAFTVWKMKNLFIDYKIMNIIKKCLYNIRLLLFHEFCFVVYKP